MVYQKQKDNFYIKKWVYVLYKLILKSGEKNHAMYFVNKVLLELVKLKKNLNFFFFVLNKNLCVPVIFRKRVVAGRKILIPTRCGYKKEINLFIRFLLDSLKTRSEKNFFEKLINELFDIFVYKGLSIKKKMHYCKEVKVNIPNLRFLKN
jgi:ribosomal protein S7